MRRITVNHDRHDNKAGPQKGFQYKDGKIFFSKETERGFFFILTILMLLLGLLAKAGLF
jgi:hypothetical protein